jgi:hypothetical protein
MLSWIIQISLISIIFIFLVHHILMFFKSTLTVPKIKDLVNSPNQKYQHIYDTISHNYSSEGYTNIELLPNNNFDYNELTTMKNTETNANTTNSMKNELKSFLKKQLNGTTENVMGMNLTPESYLNL